MRLIRPIMWLKNKHLSPNLLDVAFLVFLKFAYYLLKSAYFDRLCKNFQSTISCVTKSVNCSTNSNHHPLKKTIRRESF